MEVYIQALISNPNGLAFDLNGNLYCANSGNNTISIINNNVLINF
jgi:DNA-binding beta-propeller fold protein YncE